jgi:hypothetical protein
VPEQSSWSRATGFYVIGDLTEDEALKFLEKMLATNIDHNKKWEHWNVTAKQFYNLFARVFGGHIEDKDKVGEQIDHCKVEKEQISKKAKEIYDMVGGRIIDLQMYGGMINEGKTLEGKELHRVLKVFLF